MNQGSDEDRLLPAIASRAIYELDNKDQMCKFSIATPEVKLHGVGFRPYL